MLNRSRLWICALLFLTLVLFAGCSKQAKFERYAKRADAYFKAQKFKKSEIEYLNALRLQPTNRVVLKRLATIYHDQGKAKQAFPFWQSVCALDKDDTDARIKLGGLFLGADNQKAREQAIYVLDRQPTNDDAILLLGDSSITVTNVADAQQRLQKLRAQADHRASFHLAVSGLYLRQTNNQAAEIALRKALSLQPDSALVQKAWAEFYWQRGDLTNADQAFRKAVALAPAKSRIPLRWADFKLSTRSIKEAKEILQQITRQTPDDPGAWIRLARIAFVEQNHQECSDLLKKVLDLDPGNDEPRLWQARLKQAQGKPSEAVKVYEELQREYPRVATLELQLALAHIQNDDLPKAVTGLRRALSLDPNLGQAILLLAELNLKQGDSASAIASLRDLIKRQPNLDGAYFLLAAAYNAQGRFDDAFALFAGLEKSFPTNSGIAFLKGLTLRRLHRNAEARTAFQRASDLAPKDLLALSALVDLDLLDKNYPAALQRVRNQLAQDPRSAQAKFLEAKIFLAQTNLNEAEAAFQKTIELDPNAGPAYSSLTRIYLATNRRPQALAELQRALSRNPKEVKALMLMAMIYEQTGEVDQAAKKYEEVLEISPQSVPALNNLACLLCEKLGKIDEAYAYASKARELAPQEPGIADTLGWILYRRRDYGRGLALLQESVAKAPEEPEIQFHVGMAYYMTGQEELARAALKRALDLSQKFPGRDEVQGRLALLDTDANASDPTTLAKLQDRIKQQPDDLIALLRLGGAYERAGAPERARRAYEDARKLSPNSVPVLVRLALLNSTALKDSRQAIALAREARKLAPEDPQIAHVLGRLAWQEGDYPWASSLLQESAQRLPNNPEVLYDLAHAYYGVSRLTEAEATMRRARTTGSAFGHDQDAQWFLALIDYYKSPEKRLQAESQVQQLLKARPDYLPALMVVGLIHEQHGQVPEARQTYQRILDRNPLFAPARKQMAGLYTDHLGDQQKAQEHAAKAREVFTDDPELAKILGKIAYRRSDYRTAVRFLQESGRKQPRDAEILYFLGMAHYSLQEKNESKQALDRALALDPNASFASEAKKILAKLK